MDEDKLKNQLHCLLFEVLDNLRSNNPCVALIIFQIIFHHKPDNLILNNNLNNEQTYILD